MTEDFIKDQLTPRDYIKYQNGSEAFRSAVRAGLKAQLIQVNLLFSKLEERFSQKQSL